MTKTKAPWVSVVYMDGDEADAVLKMLYDVDGVVWSGPYEETIQRTVEHLKQWDYGSENEHTLRDQEPWGTLDCTTEVGEYTLAWNIDHCYVGLYRQVEPT